MDTENNNHSNVRITFAAILATVGVAFMSRLPQLLPGQQVIPWYQSGFFWAGIAIVVIALLILIVPPERWKRIRQSMLGFPTWLNKTYIWIRYGPTYSLDKLSLQQPLSNHEDTYKAIISLRVRNRDNDPLKVHFGGARFRFQQQLRRKRLLVTLRPTPGFPCDQEIAPHKEGNYEVPLIGLCDDADCLNSNKPYQWEIWGIAMELEGVGHRWLSKRGSSISESN